MQQVQYLGLVSCSLPHNAVLTHYKLLRLCLSVTSLALFSLPQLNTVLYKNMFVIDVCFSIFSSIIRARCIVFFRLIVFCFFFVICVIFLDLTYRAGFWHGAFFDL